MNLARKLWQRVTDLLPTDGFYFDRPLVLLQSDDWGRVGLRDREGLEQLRSAGLVLGERPYDFYTLESAEDLAALHALLTRHCDSTGRHAVLGMNFILSNLDFGKMRANGFHQVEFLPLAEGLPQGWNRPGLFAAYRDGIAYGVFRPALHGASHFCLSAVERSLHDPERAAFLRTLWQAGTPYIHWRMPWVGYEYWDPERPEDERMLSRDIQRILIGEAVRPFAKMFSALPRSVCAPGYRANDDTHRAWSQHGIHVAQNGPGTGAPPYFDQFEVLNLSRNVEFEPAVDTNFSVAACISRVETCFQHGVPAVVSVHAINLHSSVQDFRTRTLQALDEFLTILESKHPDLLYLHDDDLYEVVNKGCYKTPEGSVQVRVTRRSFTRAGLVREQARQQEA